MTNKQTVRSRWLATATAISLAGFLAGAVSAAEVQTSDTQSGMKAYKDSKTGKLRQPTSEERAAEGRQTAARAQVSAGKAPKTKVYADGTKRFQDTQGLLVESVVATKQADGTLSYSFQDGQGEVSRSTESNAALEVK